MAVNNFFTDAKWFGGGYIYGIQVLAPGGAAPSILQPGRYATIQEANVDITITLKELRGIVEDPEDIAVGQRKITGKIITGRIDISQLNNFIFQEAVTNLVGGSNAEVNDELDTIASGSVTVAQSAVFLQDLGVKYQGTRKSLVQVASAPAQGQYSVNAGTGVYTFNAGDNGTKVFISYRITQATTGHTLNVNNQLMGSSFRPVFQALFQNPNDGDQELLLYQCRASKIAFPIKVEDYVKMEIDFMAYADNLGRTMQFLSAY